MWNNEKFSHGKFFRQIDYLFSNSFCKTIAFTKFFRKKCEREFLQFPQLWHTSQCVKMKNLVSPKNISSNQFCCKICLKVPKFRKLIFEEVKTSNFAHTVWKLQKFSLTPFSQKFRESNDLLSKEITK